MQVGRVLKKQVLTQFLMLQRRRPNSYKYSLDRTKRKGEAGLLSQWDGSQFTGVQEGFEKVHFFDIKSLSHVRLSATPWTVAYQDPPSMEFSRQEYWSGLLFPSPLPFLLAKVEQYYSCTCVGDARKKKNTFTVKVHRDKQKYYLKKEK